MKYKGFELDEFQIKSIEAINKNHSVVVSAATGTGKTLIADYVINEAIKEGKEVIYTSPIKALSNQKFREFKEAYGDKVGLLTGDIVINPEAQILIMTTEIYRNMLLEKKEAFPNLSYVVFDEIHYINDIERGTVWEESLIFSPSHIRFVCLSATIPNHKEFANWISNIKDHEVETVNYMKRAVPLEHQIYDFNLGVSNIQKLKDDLKNDGPMYKFSKERRNKRGKKVRRARIPLTNFTKLLEQLNTEAALPAIYFTFSRKDAFSKAIEMSRKFDFTTASEKKEIIEFLRKNIPENISSMESVHTLKSTIKKGFGVHHAGILPKMKEIVEKLFAKGLIKVLFATETFAVGINMPAKTVVMNSIKKYDGISTRYLSTKEYFQMAGRAGRRGIDTFGRVIVIIDRNDLNIEELERVTSKDVEPITSRFNISYNTVLNLIKNHSKKEREVILKSNFGFFLRRTRNQNRIDQSYLNYLRTLKKMGYVNQKEDDVSDYSLTWKGHFATHVFSYDLVIPELYYSKIMEDLTEKEFLILLTAFEYEGRLSDKFDTTNVDITNILDVVSENRYVFKRLKKKNLKNMYKLVSYWYNGKEFSELMEICNLAEGDIIRLFRRILDGLKQIKTAIYETEKDSEMISKIKSMMSKIDRDIISIEI